MILLSPHIDTVKSPFKLSFKGGVHSGLLDNSIGFIASYLAVYGVESILQIAKKGEIEIYHNWGEEFGLLLDAPKMTKKDIVIVVDVCCGKNYKGLDFTLENIANISNSKIKEIKENLEWEGFKMKTKRNSFNEEEADEAFSWAKLGIPVISFIIPIDGGKEDQWHSEDCTISSEAMKRAVTGLQRLLCYIS